MSEGDEVPDGVPIQEGEEGGADWSSWDVWAHSQRVDGGAQRWAWFTAAPADSCKHVVETIWKSGLLECSCGGPVEAGGTMMDDGY